MYQIARVLCVCLALHSAVAVISPNTKPHGEECRSIVSIIEEVFLEYLVAYFVDNPRGSNPAINPEDVKPLTATKLFSEFYGEGSSSESFKNAIIQV